MLRDTARLGLAELRAARAESRALYWFTAVFSFFVNMLMLTGPLYMLNVYDRVLGSRSVETLIALTVLVAFLYGMMALLDYARGRIMARVGARFQTRMERRVFEASIRASSQSRAPAEAATALRDLEQVQRMIVSPVLMAFFDLPWAPIYFAGIFLFHPILGFLALGGSAILVAIAVANQSATRKPLETANSAGFRADQMGSQIRGESEMVQALGMRGHAFSRWHAARGDALTQSIRANDMAGTFATVTKAFRLFLQSAMLGLGAWLAIQGSVTPGAMIAGSILMGRALQPIEMLVNQWPVIQKGREGWQRLSVLLGAIRPEARRTDLPRPRAMLDVNQLTVIPPGQQQASLRMISFRAAPGQAIGVIGPSGAGKSTLAKALTGVWPAAGGKVRLDGAALDQYDPDTLGKYIGYLPQRVQLFDGTIKDNIARMSPDIDDAAVVRAAQAAAAHDMILSFPDGYDTRVSATGGQLSGGQIQRIGLARAIYGDPVMLVLDEPNSNLDNDGTEALNAAIRHFKASERLVLIMAHRPAAIRECDLLLVIENGMRRAFGPRDEVLRETVRNHGQIAATPGQGGVS